jgi:hypothetical protein
VNGDDGVEHVGFAGEHGLQFELFGVVDERRNLPFEIRLGEFAFAGELEVRFDVVGTACEFGFVSEQGFEPLTFAPERLRARGICPDRGVGYFFFDGGEFTAKARLVKDTPAVRGLCRAPGSRSIRDRKASL